MAKKVKITKGGQTVYPATVMDAVVHPDLRVDASKLIEEVNVSKIYPTGGIDGTNKYTLETAIAKIPSSLRNVGLKCSFLNEAGVLETWEYRGGSFTSSSSWEQGGAGRIEELLRLGYIFAGIATPTTNPGTPDGPVFYIATNTGTYPNFEAITIKENDVKIFLWNGSWVVLSTGIPVLSNNQLLGENCILPDLITDNVIINEKDDIVFTEGYIKNNGVVGSIVDLTILSTSANTKCAIVNCSFKDVFYIYAKGGNAGRLFSFLDENNRIISVAEKNTVLYDGCIETPINAVKVVFNIDNLGDYIRKTEYNNDNVKLLWNTSSKALDILNNTYKVSDYFGIVFRTGNRKVISPANAGETISILENGFLVYNYKDNKVYFRTSYSDLEENGDTILAVIRDGFVGGGNPVSLYFSKFIRQRLASTFYFYYPDSSTTFTKNSVTTYGARLISFIKQGTTIEDDIIKDDNGDDKKETFIFNENSYLVFNRTSKKARIVNSYSLITKEEVIWLFFRDGSFCDGLFFNYYISYMNNFNFIKNDIYKSDIYKRAHQFLDIKWTALKPIASTSSTTGISAGEHVGLPYTSCMEVDKMIGFDVSLRTFMTAVNNPYSLIYTEDLNRNISGYGFTYHNTGRGTIGGYMGIVCNIFGLNAISYPIPYDTGNFKYLMKRGLFKKISEQNADNLEMGDIIIEPGHCNVIINIREVSNSNKTIYWGESVMDFPVVNEYTIDDANNRLKSNNGIIYRVNCAYKQYYEKSPFVAVGDETFTPDYNYNNDICTFAGDYAAFRKGQKIVINYNLKVVKDYTSIEIYKDDDLQGTYNIEKDSNNFDLTDLFLEEGYYKARLTNGVSYSDYTYFQIIDTDVSYSLDGDNITVLFNSNIGYPIFVRLCKIDGGPICIIDLTEDNIRAGNISFDYKKYGSSQGYELIEGGTYLKVYFEAEYGRVTNEPILISEY